MAEESRGRRYALDPEEVIEPGLSLMFLRVEPGEIASRTHVTTTELIRLILRQTVPEPRTVRRTLVNAITDLAAAPAAPSLPVEYLETSSKGPLYITVPVHESAFVTIEPTP